MVAHRLRCCVCSSAFYGRADARFCCGACRQKAYRACAHEAHRTAARGQAAATRQRAKETVKRARTVEQQAAAIKRKADATLAAARDSLDRRRARWTIQTGSEFFDRTNQLTPKDRAPAEGQFPRTPELVPDQKH